MQSSPDATEFAEASGEPLQPPDTPHAPIDLPRRRSSLGFSHITSSETQDVDPRLPIHADVQATPSRAQTAFTSNVGKKRATVSPLTRAIATPGHNAQMRNIFQKAQVSLRRDIAFASSPEGSIASRLPPSDPAEAPEMPFALPEHAQLRPPRHRVRDWRYSMAPQTVAKIDVDIREPLPEQSPLLPNPFVPEDAQLKSMVAEPTSSGFTSPACRQETEGHVEDAPLYPPLPDSGSSESKSESVTSLRSLSRPLSHGSSSSNPNLSTELERPLTDFHVNQSDVWEENAIDDSPSVNRRSRRSSRNVVLEATPSPKSPENEIFLSTPARAAAESAKAKRGLSTHEMLSTSNKENIRPPRQCPNPSLHYGTPVNMLGLPPHRMTPASHTTNNSAARDTDHHSLRAPAAIYNRVDSRGSPLPFLKSKSPPTSPRTPQYLLHQGHFSSPPRRDYPQISQEPVRISDRLYEIPSRSEHLQAGWTHLTLPQQQRSFAQHSAYHSPFAYSFSTAAAKSTGSSVAPDSFIRDSYSTDTLTKLLKPPTRFRKNGIAAVSKAVNMRYDGGEPLRDRPPMRTVDAGLRRERMPLSHAGVGIGLRGSEAVRFLSSPPRPVGFEAVPPRGKRVRKQDFGRDSFEIREDEHEVIGSIVDTADNVARSAGEETDLRELSPNVTPFRKGRTPRRRKRSRSANYWDRDILEDQMSSPRKEDSEMAYIGGTEHESGTSFNAEEGSLGDEVAKADELLKKTLPGYVDARAGAAKGEEERGGGGEDDDDENCVEMMECGEED